MQRSGYATIWIILLLQFDIEISEEYILITYKTTYQPQDKQKGKPFFVLFITHIWNQICIIRSRNVGENRNSFLLFLLVFLSYFGSIFHFFVFVLFECNERKKYNKNGILNWKEIYWVNCNYIVTSYTKIKTPTKQQLRIYSGNSNNNYYCRFTLASYTNTSIIN